jgi:hypothetical protein
MRSKMTNDEAAQIVAELMPIGGTSRECKALTIYVRAIHAVKDKQISALRSAAEIACHAIDEHLGDTDPNDESDPLLIAHQRLSAVLYPPGTPSYPHFAKWSPPG